MREQGELSLETKVGVNTPVTVTTAGIDEYPNGVNFSPVYEWMYFEITVTGTEGDNLVATVYDVHGVPSEMIFPAHPDGLTYREQVRGAVYKGDAVSDNGTLTVTFKAFQGNINKNLKVGRAAEDDVHTYPEWVDVERGRFDELKNDYAYGRVSLIDASDAPATVWAFGDDDEVPRLNKRVFTTTPSNFYIASDNALDTSLTFEVHGIDENGDFLVIQATTDATNGQTPVNIGYGLDLNFMFINMPDGDPQGNIYITNADNFLLGLPVNPSQVLVFTPQGYGCSPQCMLRVANNRQVVINKIILTLSRAGGASGSAIIHCRAKRAGGSWIVVREWHIQTGTAVLPTNNMVFGAGDIVEMELFDVSDNDTSLGAELHFTYVDLEKA